MKIGKTIFALLTTTALALPALALQTNSPPPKRTGEQKKFSGETTQGKRGWSQGERKGWKRGPGPHGGDWLRKMSDLPPEEQERALQSDPEFQRLAPEDQTRLRQRLRKFNSLPSEQKQRIFNRWERFEHLTPEQQARLRGYHDRLREMPDERRRMMYRALRALRDMPPQERDRTLSSERFRNTFSPEERTLLRRMAEIEPAPREDERGAPQSDEPPPPRD